MGDQALFNEIANLLASYHWELDEGDFVVVVPNKDFDANIQNALQVSLDGRKIYTVVGTEQMELSSRPILVLDTMIRDKVSPTLFGGYLLKQGYTSQQNSQRYISMSRGVGHRMCTKEFFFKLPVIDRTISKWHENPDLQLGLPLQQVLSMWTGDVFSIVSLLSLLERFTPSLLVFPLAYAQETDNAYQLMNQGFTKNQHLPFGGRDHVETMLNLWMDLLHYLSQDGGRTVSLLDLVDSNRVGSWCQVRSINIQPMMNICSLVVSTMDKLNQGDVVNLGLFQPKLLHDEAYPLLESVFEDRILYRKDDSIHPMYVLPSRAGVNFSIGSSLMVSFMENIEPDTILGLVLDKDVESSNTEIIIGMIHGDKPIEVEFHDTLNRPPKLTIEPLVEDESIDEPYYES